MTSLILRTTARYQLPLWLLFSLFLFLRGHNEPGGGFVAGLLAAAAFALYSIAYGATETRRVLRIDPRLLIGLGLLVAIGSGSAGLFLDGQLMSGHWFYITLPGLERWEIGTPMLFDLGVYLAVTGVTITVVLALEEAE